jgi:hypothetical protein
MSQLFEDYPMLLLGLEAFGAAFLLIFIVVWTMSGAKKHPPRPLRAPPDHASRSQETPTATASTEPAPKDSGNAPSA